MTREEMEQCPFCASRCVTKTINHANWPIVQCDDCGACGPCIDSSDDRAVTRWNTRLSAQADVRAATIEECAKVAENVDDVLRGGCKSEDDEWLWTNGGREMQSDIAKAIRALSDAKQPEGK
jgi:hypothetical protein